MEVEKLYSKEVNSSFQNMILVLQYLILVNSILNIWPFSYLGRRNFGFKRWIDSWQLIAFRILSGYVTTPLLRLSSIWQDFKTCLSIERLSDVINYKKEDDEIEDLDKPHFLYFRKVEYKSATYKFQKNQPSIISNISLNIKEKSFVGIVGESGSRKITLKIASRLINPDSGKIL